MAVKAGDGHLLLLVDIGENFVRAFIVARPDEVEIRLHIFYLDQQMFPQDFHLVEFYQISELRCGVLDGCNNIDAAADQDETNEAEGCEYFLFHFANRFLSHSSDCILIWAESCKYHNVAKDETVIITPTLHKYFYLFVSGIRKAVVFTATMLDAGYLMLDILKFPTSEIEKHPVARNQYPGSRNITNDLHYKD